MKVTKCDLCKTISEDLEYYELILPWAYVDERGHICGFLTKEMDICCNCARELYFKCKEINDKVMEETS